MHGLDHITAMNNAPDITVEQDKADAQRMLLHLHTTYAEYALTKRGSAESEHQDGALVVPKAALPALLAELRADGLIINEPS